MHYERLQLREKLKVHLLGILLPKDIPSCPSYCRCLYKLSSDFLGHAQKEQLDVNKLETRSVASCARIIKLFSRGNVKRCDRSSIFVNEALGIYDSLQGGMDEVLAYPGFTLRTLREAKAERRAKTKAMRNKTLSTPATAEANTHVQD